MPDDKKGPTTGSPRDGLGLTSRFVDMRKGMGSTPISSAVDPFAAAGVRATEGGGTGTSGTGGSTSGSGSSVSGSTSKK